MAVPEILGHAGTKLSILSNGKDPKRSKPLSRNTPQLIRYSPTH